MVACTSYTPAPEHSGGWRERSDPRFLRSIGLEPQALAALWASMRQFADRRPAGMTSSPISLLIIKDGWLVAEEQTSPTARHAFVSLHSNTKLVAAILMGRLAFTFPDKPYRLSTPIGDAISACGESSYSRLTLPCALQVGHLLSHTSCLPPNATGRVQYDFSRDLEFEAYLGEMLRTLDDPWKPDERSTPIRRRYSCAGFQLLEYALAKMQLGSTARVVRDLVMAPLGISTYKHGQRVQATATKYDMDLATGMALLPRDFARLMYLLATGGLWRGRRLLGESWLAEYQRIVFDHVLNEQAQTTLAPLSADVFFSLGEGMCWGWAFPSKCLVVVFTGGLPSELWHLTQREFLSRVLQLLD